MKKHSLFACSTALALLLSLGACDSANQGESVAYRWSNVAIGGGGYITGITYNPTEEGLCYVRTDIGGAYRRDQNSNGKWVPITDEFGGYSKSDWAYQGVEAIATDPVEPNRVYLAVGAYMGDKGALLASDDYGNTWKYQCEMDFSCGANCSGRGSGERMMVDPKNHNIIWFGSRNAGLWKSEDFGETWNQVTSMTDYGNYVQEGNAIGCLWIEFDPVSNDMYVAVANTDGNCIYKTTDGGASFEALPANSAGYYPTQSAISSNGYLYLSYADTAGPNKEARAGVVYRYSLKEGKYEEITPQNDSGRYGGFGGIAVDPQNPDVVLLTTLGYYSQNGENFFRSTDGGENWDALFDQEQSNYQMDVSQAQWLDWGREMASTGWWVSDIEIDPFHSDIATYGTGATLYSFQNLTDMGSDKTVTIAFDALGIEETAVFKVVSALHDGTKPQLYSIMGDLTGFSHMDVEVAPDDNHFMKNGVPEDVAVAYQNSNVAVYTNDSKRTPLTYTIDGGVSWQNCENLPCLSQKGKVAVSADGSSFIWIPGDYSGQAYVTKDMGSSWYACGGLSFGSKITADKVNPKKFYANCSGKLYISEDGGMSFNDTGVLLSDGAELLSAGDKEGHIWCVSGTQLQYSTDSGKTFHTIENFTAKAIGFGCGKKEGDSPVIYAIGADSDAVSGIYRSENLGKTWQRINDDMHEFGNLSGCIEGDASVYGRVYLTVNGRGIVMGDVDGQ